MDHIPPPRSNYSVPLNGIAAARFFFHFFLFCCQLPGTSIHPSTFFHPSYHFVSFKHSHFSLSMLNSFFSFILLFILLSLLASIMRTAPLPPQCSVKPVSIPDIYRYRCRPSLCQHFPLQQQWENLAGASQQSPTGRRLRPGYFPIKMFFLFFNLWSCLCLTKANIRKVEGFCLIWIIIM